MIGRAESSHVDHLQLEDEVLDQKAEFNAPNSLLKDLQTLHAHAASLERARIYFCVLEEAERHRLDPHKFSADMVLTSKR